MQKYQILKQFEDSPEAPYSIHRIAAGGVKYGKSIGDWFAPSTAAQVLRYKSVVFN